MLTYNPNDNWPRFLVVEAADDNPKPFTFNAFAWHKAVEGMGGSYKSIKPMNDGKQLLVHLENKAYNDNLLRAETDWRSCESDTPQSTQFFTMCDWM